jgi:hypothetical protein
MQAREARVIKEITFDRHRWIHNFYFLSIYTLILKTFIIQKKKKQTLLFLDDFIT